VKRNAASHRFRESLLAFSGALFALAIHRCAEAATTLNLMPRCARLIRPKIDPKIDAKIDARIAWRNTGKHRQARAKIVGYFSSWLVYMLAETERSEGCPDSAAPVSDIGAFSPGSLSSAMTREGEGL
jgi:hypothetical protein